MHPSRRKSAIATLLALIILVVGQGIRAVPLLDLFAHTRELVGNAIGFLYPKSEVMSGANLRVAVAGFAGDKFDQSTRIELAERILRRLERDISKQIDGPTVLIWGPNKVGSVNGSTPVERSTSAAEIARRVNANVVVYGVLLSTANATLLPEFYVSQEESVVAGSGTGDYWNSELAQLAGAYYLGRPIATTAPLGNLVATILVDDEFSCRSQVLLKAIYGLAYYSMSDYAKAEREFSQAGELNCSDKESGIEVLYVMAGNAAGRSGNTRKGLEYYYKALRIDPSYARALLGLASASYVQAAEIARLLSQTSGSQSSETALSQLLLSNKLKESESYYIQALQSAYQSTQASAREETQLSDALTLCETAPTNSHESMAEMDIRPKACFGLGQAAFLRSYLQKDGYGDASRFLRTVLNEYPDNERIRVLAAESAILLGRISRELCDRQSAISYYKEALQLHPDVARQTTIGERLDELESSTSVGCTD